MQGEIDRANAVFWDEPCGTTNARFNQIDDHSQQSLMKFDQLYFDYYPYLLRHVPVERMRDKKVLEIGLGYGSLGMKIAQEGAEYYGLDIANGPVELMRHRLKLLNLNASLSKGSVLECPYPDECMDMVVTIGCLHHTGDVQRAIDEIYRVLKSGGVAYIMLYNQRSYQQWMKWPWKTFLSLLNDFHLIKKKPTISRSQRAAYDNNTEGESAPETVFTSICEVKKMMSKFSSVVCEKENSNSLYYPFFCIISRAILLKTIGKLCGLDLYITAKK